MTPTDELRLRLQRAKALTARLFDPEAHAAAVALITAAQADPDEKMPYTDLILDVTGDEALAGAVLCEFMALCKVLLGHADVDGDRFLQLWALMGRS